MGCLGGLATLFVVILVAKAIFDLIFYPWIYTVGERQRYIPIWQGVGSTEGPGGKYTFYVWFSPTREHATVRPNTAIDGRGYICAPTGKSHDVLVRGGATGQVYKDMNGHEFHLRLQHRPWSWAFTEPNSAQPRVNLYGRWSGSKLVFEDQGSLSRAFNADGSVTQGNRASGGAAVSVTIEENNWWPSHPCPGK